MNYEQIKEAAFQDELQKIAKGELKPGSFSKHVKKEPAAKAPVGEGKRFSTLKNKLSREKGVTNPGAIAAAIGRAKFGKKKFQHMAAKGK